MKYSHDIIALSSIRFWTSGAQFGSKSFPSRYATSDRCRALLQRKAGCCHFPDCCI